ncbi:MAG: IS110 family transposase [Planctomycetota bacterium]
MSLCPYWARTSFLSREVRKMLYAGLDVHMESSHVTVMDESGKVIRRRSIPSTREAIHRQLDGNGESVKAVMEATRGWGPIYDWLEEVCQEVLLAHPLKVRAIAEARIKTDKIDSETLAHLLRADLVPEAYAPSRPVRAVKRVLRQRLFLVRVRTMLKNRIQALLRSHAVERPSFSDLYGKAGMKWLGSVELPYPDGELLGEDLALLEVLNERIESTEQLIEKLSEGDAAVRWLKSIPGIGRFLSVLIRYEVDDIGRFRNPKKFASYTGLVPSTYASGGRRYHGRLTKQGNKWLRWALIEAVWPAIRVAPDLRRYYERIKRRHGSKTARAATARKIAHLVWHVWTEEREYEVRR